MRKLFLLLGLLSLCPLYLFWKSDFSIKKIPVQTFILGGKIVSPEGSSVLEHYISGKGGTLYLDSAYIKNSDVVKRAILDLKVGESKRVSFKQKEDWRLSYALNPFNVKRNEDGYEIYQWIEFDTTNKTYTYLNLGFFKLKVYDNLAHAYKCKPFMVKCKFTKS
jgi:hypothetical protein